MNGERNSSEQGVPAKNYNLNVNKKEHPWHDQFISGAQIKELAGSPSDYVVNQVVPGPAGDPEIADGQQVDLDHRAEPQGIKKFVTRKPTTTPGA